MEQFFWNAAAVLFGNGVLLGVLVLASVLHDYLQRRKVERQMHPYLEHLCRESDELKDMRRELAGAYEEIDKLLEKLRSRQ